MELFESVDIVVLLVLACVGLIVVGSILLFVFVSRVARDPKIENGVLGQATILKI
jgi:hypothetical protein